MVTEKQYGSSFSRTISQYANFSTSNKMTYSGGNLSNHLIKRRVQDWLKDALAHPYRDQRIQAIQNLGRYGSGRWELGILTRLSEHDPDLELRAIAEEAVGQIKTRIS